MGKKKRAELREEMKLILANLDERWIKAASMEVCERLRMICEQLSGELEHVLLFQPLLHGSVDLSAFLLSQLEAKRHVYIPCDLESKGFYEVDREVIEGISLHELRTTTCRRIVDAPFMLDDARSTAVVIPGLAFDYLGNRIGWGRLNYETLMSSSGLGQARCIGVCWSLQCLDELPAGSTDLLMDWVVHERDVIPTGTGAMGSALPGGDESSV